METYVIRIYRRSESIASDGRMLVGVLEKAEKDSPERVFHNLDDLVRLLKLQKHWATIKGSKDSATDEVKSLRYKLNLPVKVQGVSSDGMGFTEDTTLLNIGAGGAYIYLGRSVEIGARLRLIIDPGQSDLEMSGMVVRVDGGADEKRGVGITFDTNC